MVWMGGVANGGKAAVPYLVLKTEGGLPHPPSTSPAAPGS